MADPEEQKISIPDPEAVKARVFPGAGGQRLVSPVPDGLRAHVFAAAEGERPVSALAGGGEGQAAHQLPGAEGERPVSAPVVEQAPVQPSTETTQTAAPASTPDHSAPEATLEE